ncbi:NUDIX hydrolase [Glutamicibacter sp.]|uniref:NUDIX hydrolase n=1 Tax=Glutamicibacter sp. TaxID=1931995 RepID=UPI002FDFD4C1
MSNSGNEALDTVPIRRAASVLMLRENSQGLEVFVQHRVSTMDFAAGMVVFPGGRVDTKDSDSVSTGSFDDSMLAAHAQRWANTSVWDQGEALAPQKSGEVLAAALREVFEETGLRLEAQQLVPWANWVTPVGFPRRFDTYFFVAALGDGQDPLHQTTEAVRSQWAKPGGLFAGLERGELKMMRPTQRTLLDAMALGSLDAILADQSVIRSVHPDPQDSHSSHPVRATEIAKPRP